MIKFFRKIRYDLMKNPTSDKATAGSKTGKPASRTGRYIKYALGEIVLVMIGILLALQVNDWNNNRLEISKEQLHLKNLQSDFKTNLAETNRTYKLTSEAYEASVRLLEIIKDDSKINPAEIEKLLDDILNKITSLDLISGSIDEIINTGSLTIIRDPALRKQLSNWSFYVADYMDDVEIYEDYLFGKLLPSLTRRTILRNASVPGHFEDDLDLSIISNSNFTIDYNKTIRTLEFENQIYFNALNYMYVLNSYKIMEAYLNDTLVLIEGNIKN